MGTHEYLPVPTYPQGFPNTGSCPGIRQGMGAGTYPRGQGMGAYPLPSSPPLPIDILNLDE